MICIKADIPEKICKINDELKAIYHSKESVYLDFQNCIRKKFIYERNRWNE